MQQSFVEEVVENKFRVMLAKSKVQPHQPWYKFPTIVFATHGRVGHLTGNPEYPHPQGEAALDTPVFQEIDYPQEDTPGPDETPLGTCSWP